MVNILSEVFKAVLYILGIVATVSLIRGLIMFPFENKKRKEIEKKEYEEAKKRFQLNNEILATILKDLIKETEKKEKNTKKIQKKTNK